LEIYFYYCIYIGLIYYYLTRATADKIWGEIWAGKEVGTDIASGAVIAGGAYYYNAIGIEIFYATYGILIEAYAGSIGESAYFY
jgi:hypothetical protein